MKKVLLFVAVVSAISFASCKKDRVCTCTQTESSVPGSYTTITTFTKAKKGDARAACLSSTIVENGKTYTKTCSLK